MASLDFSWSDSIVTAVDTYVYSTVYGHIAYVTHAFKQSADSSGLCPIQVACGLGIGSWCCVVEPMLIELVKTTTIMYYYYIVHNFI